MIEQHIAVTIAEAMRAILGGMLFGLGAFAIVFIIIRRKYERP
jgi:hypothetical protein